MASNIVPFPRRPANDNGGGDDGPQQPGLRAFIVYDEAPEGCFIFEVASDRSAPHLRDGDFALVDPSDCEPMHGELFLRECGDGTRDIVELGKFPRPECIVGRDAATEYWNCYWQLSLARVDGTTAEQMRWGDGPRATKHQAAQLRGRVVGLYRPDFRSLLPRAA